MLFFQLQLIQTILLLFIPSPNKMSSEKQVFASNGPLPTTLRITTKNSSQSQQLNQQIKLISESIRELTDKIQSLPSQPSSEQNMKDEGEERFSWIKVEIPTIEDASSDYGRKQLKKWLGKITGMIFSKGFRLFEQGKLNKIKMRIFCSQNMISNLIEMIRRNKLSTEEIQVMNECLQKDIMPYLIYKYPKSESSEINLKFANLIRNVDTYDDNENDFIFMSGVHFQYSESGHYFKEIMRFLNYIIKLPDEKETIEVNEDEKGVKKKQISLEDYFQRDMNLLFKKVYNEEEVKKMRKFNLKKIKGKQEKGTGMKEFASENRENEPVEIEYKREGSTISFKKNKSVFSGNEEELESQTNYSQKPFEPKETRNSQQQKDYEEKVDSYTKYEISRKTSENTESFTQEEMEAGLMNIKNTRIIRILVKWCEELQKNFHLENILNREEPFRMLDGCQEFLATSELQRLGMILEEEKKKVEERKQKLLQNSYDQQKLLSMEKLEEEFSYLPENESKVGFFSSIMLKNEKYYIINYLNALIHGLLSATQKFIGKTKIEEQEKQNIPQLVSFRVGDLLRCKCTSKETEIIALYNQIERIHHYYPEVLRIVKINNKLQTETRNILITLMYRSKLIVEMQLGINSDKSNFILCSDYFNHMIYELQRSLFGPLTELCNMWIYYDTRGEFFQKKQKELQNKPLLKKERHTCKGEQEEITEPFKCGICEHYYSRLHVINNHKKCLVCQKNVCIYCRLQFVENYEEMRKIFPILPEQSEEGKYKIVQGKNFVEKEVPDFGLLLPIESIKNGFKGFRKIGKGIKKLVITVEQKGGKEKYQIINEVTKQKEVKKLFRKYVIIHTEDMELKQRFQKITEALLENEFFVPRSMESVIQREKQSLCLNKEFIADGTLKKIVKKGKSFPHLKKINLMDNSLSNFSLISTMFDKVERAVLNNNKFKQISDDCLKMKNLKYLHLSSNQIQTISPNINELHELKVLNISENRNLKTFPEMCNCMNLQKIYFNHTKVEKLPKNIDMLKSIKVLEGSHTNLSQIPAPLGLCQSIQKIDFSFSKIQRFDLEDLKWGSLVELDLSATKIKMLPKTIENCENLAKVYLSSCQELQELPKEIGQCSNLGHVDLSFTQKLTTLPKDFQSLQDLNYLNLYNSSVSKLPSMKNFKKLKILKIQKSKVENLPEDIGFCQNLSKLYLNESNIKTLPQSLGNCQKLLELNLSHTKISEFPEFMDHLVNMEKLNISFTEIKELPQWFANYPKLSDLRLSKLSLEKLPTNFTKFISLQRLDIAHNQIKDFPVELLSLTTLVSLNLGNNNIKKLPMEIDELKALRDLDLEKNLIEQLPEKFINLKNLKSLSIRKGVEIPEMEGLDVYHY